MITFAQSLRAFGVAAAALLASALALPTTARDVVRPGQPAPEFVAKDTAGREVTLTSFKGKTVVLEWTNHDCPYVKKHYGTGNMQALQKEAVGQGVVWLTISSSAAGGQGHVSGLEAEKLTAARNAAPSAFLLDPEGRIGRAFGATATPHMYVIDKAGVLAYMGAIDDKPTTNPSDVPGARNYVREALAAVAAGQPVKTAATRVYGCSIKYSEPRS
jgi:peroxiredoxin